MYRSGDVIGGPNAPQRNVESPALALGRIVIGLRGYPGVRQPRRDAIAANAVWSPFQCHLPDEYDKGSLPGTIGAERSSGVLRRDRCCGDDGAPGRLEEGMGSLRKEEVARVLIANTRSRSP